MVKYILCGVRVKKFVWNFKGHLWNFTLYIEPIPYKMCTIPWCPKFNAIIGIHYFLYNCYQFAAKIAQHVFCTKWHVIYYVINLLSLCITHSDTIILAVTNPDSKVHGANMGPTWVLSAPDRPHVGPMNLAGKFFILAMQCKIWTWLYYVNII